jgi:hypothetical protein
MGVFRSEKSLHSPRPFQVIAPFCLFTVVVSLGRLSAEFRGDLGKGLL